METKLTQFDLKGKGAEEVLISMFGIAQTIHILAGSATRAGLAVLFETDPPVIEFYKDGELTTRQTGALARDAVLNAQQAVNVHRNAFTLQEAILAAFTVYSMHQNETVTIEIRKVSK